MSKYSHIISHSRIPDNELSYDFLALLRSMGQSLSASPVKSKHAEQGSRYFIKPAGGLCHWLSNYNTTCNKFATIWTQMKQPETI